MHEVRRRFADVVEELGPSFPAVVYCSRRVVARFNFLDVFVDDAGEDLEERANGVPRVGDSGLFVLQQHLAAADDDWSS